MRQLMAGFKHHNETLLAAGFITIGDIYSCKETEQIVATIDKAHKTDGSQNAGPAASRKRCRQFCKSINFIQCKDENLLQALAL